MKRGALGAASAESAGIISEGNILLRFTIVGRLRRDRGQVSMWVNPAFSLCFFRRVKCQKIFIYVFIRPWANIQYQIIRAYLESENQTNWRRGTGSLGACRVVSCAQLFLFPRQPRR